MNGSAVKLRRAVENHKIIAFDTAPFIYYIEDVAPYADLLDLVFGLINDQTVAAVTSAVTLAEILAKPFADKNFSLAEEIKFILKSLASLTIVSIDDKLAEAAALIRARYKIRLPDAFQIAAALEGEASLFLTNDKAVKKVDAIEVVVLSEYL
jgi:predicted nucleic acid-binding protein